MGSQALPFVKAVLQYNFEMCDHGLLRVSTLALCLFCIKLPTTLRYGRSK